MLIAVRQTIKQGWPETKSEVPEMLHSYYDFRDELTVQDNLVFKGRVLVVPVAMRKQMLALTHASHIGVEGCLRRAREIMFWPRMSTELREYISKCDVCIRHRDTPSKEPLQPRDVEARPWAKVAADLCNLNGRMLLVTSDYFTNFIEVERISKITTQGICKALKVMFARYGIPDVLVTDNGPQFSSAEFEEFAKTWGFEHVTSSYPQSNGKAENALKTVKRLFKKCQETGQSEYLALLDWRNTPTEGMGTSPAQRFLGRRCKTRLPTGRALLKPRYSTEEDARTLQTRKRRQQYYYDRHTRSLPRICEGETIYMRLPGQTTWSSGVCMGMAGPRSYRVRVGGHEFRRNRRQLLRPSEPLRMHSDAEAPEIPIPFSTEAQLQPNMEMPLTADQTTIQSTTSTPNGPTEEPSPSPPSELQRPTRTRKAPRWLEDYVPS